MLIGFRNKFKTLKNHTGFRRYAANTTWILAEQFLRIIAALFVGVWIARYLGPEQFGILSYALAFTSIFGAIAKFGLDAIVVRELVGHPEQRDIFLGTAFWLKMIGAFFVIASLALILPLTSNEPRTNIYIFIISAGLVFQSFEVVEFYFQSQVKGKLISICKVSQLAVTSIVKIYLVLTEAELISFVVVTLVDSLILAISYSIAYLLNNNPKFFNHFDLKIAKKLIKDSWPLILSGIALMVQARIDQVMIQEFKGSTEVGYYSVAMRLIEVMAFMPMVIKNSLFPAIQSAKVSSEKLYTNRLLNFYRLNFILFALVAIPICLFSEKIVTTLFGESYQAAGPLLALMAFRLFFTNMGVARSAYLIAENLMKFSLFTMLIGTAFNIALNYLWIPEYGGKGAIIATIVSFMITIYCLDIIYSKTRWNVVMQLKSIITPHKLSLRN